MCEEAGIGCVGWRLRRLEVAWCAAEVEGKKDELAAAEIPRARWEGNDTWDGKESEARKQDLR